MVEAIKPLLRLATEKKKTSDQSKFNENREKVEEQRIQKRIAETSVNQYKEIKQQISKEHEKVEKELIQLNIEDNKQRENIYREFAKKRAQIWRMKAQAAKDTMRAGRYFAAETAAMSKLLTKNNIAFSREKKLKAKREFVEKFRESKKKKEQVDLSKTQISYE